VARIQDGRPFVRGRPLDIDFLGFRSDTFRLQQEGWEIAEERDSHRMDSFRIAIRHPAQRLSGMSKPYERGQLFHYQQYAHDHYGACPIQLTVSIAVQYHIQANEHTVPHFIPVDATPYEDRIYSYDLFEQPYFRPLDEGKEIFLREATVSEIMQIALDKQEPEQAEIRARRTQEAKRENYNRGGTTRAKLIAV